GISPEGRGLPCRQNRTACGPPRDGSTGAWRPGPGERLVLYRREPRRIVESDPLALLHAIEELRALEADQAHPDGAHFEETRPLVRHINFAVPVLPGLGSLVLGRVEAVLQGEDDILAVPLEDRLARDAQHLLLPFIGETTFTRCVEARSVWSGMPLSSTMWNFSWAFCSFCWARSNEIFASRRACSLVYPSAKSLCWLP